MGRNEAELLRDIARDGAYRAAFGMMLAWSALSIVLLAFTRETYCRQAR